MEYNEHTPRLYCQPLTKDVLIVYPTIEMIKGKYELLDMTHNCVTYPRDKVWLIEGLKTYIDKIAISEDGSCKVIYRTRDGQHKRYEGTIIELNPGFKLEKYYIDFHGELLFIETPELIGRYRYVSS